MTHDTTVRMSCETSTTISVNCVPFGGTRGFATLLVDQRREEIVLDAQVTGGCMIILDEAGAAALFAVLAAWLAEISVVQGVKAG